MLSSVLTKTLWERRFGMIGWVIGGLAAVLIMIAIYPVVRDSAEFVEAIESLPEEIIALAGIDPAFFTTGAGFLQAQMYTLLGPLLVLILAVGIGASATATEESSGTADLLLATPVRRPRVVIDKALAMVVLTGILVLSFVVGLLIGQVTVELGLSASGIVGVNLGLLLLGLFFGSLALLVGAWTGRRTLAIAVGGGLAAVSFVLDSFAPLVESFETIQPYTPFYWYSGDTPILDGPTARHLLLAAGLLIFSAAAAYVFTRRDIGVFAGIRLPFRREREGKAKSSTSPLLGTIWGKDFWDRRRSFWWWLAGIGLLAALTISIYPSVREGSDDVWQGILDAYPAELLAMFGITDVDSLLTGGGLVSSRVYQSIGLIAFLAFGIGMGKAAVAGEEKEGTADLLLSTPPTRDRVVVGKSASMLVLLLALLTGVAVVVWIGNLIVDLGLNWEGLIAANLGMAFLAFLFGAIALATGAATGSPGTSIAVASAAGVALFLLNGFGAVVDWLEPIRPLSPFFWYQGDTNPLNQSLGWQQPLLLAVGLGFVAVAIFLFRRRDIGT